MSVFCDFPLGLARGRARPAAPTPLSPHQPPELRERPRATSTTLPGRRNKATPPPQLVAPGGTVPHPASDAVPLLSDDAVASWCLGTRSVWPPGPAPPGTGTVWGWSVPLWCPLGPVTLGVTPQGPGPVVGRAQGGWGTRGLSPALSPGQLVTLSWHREGGTRWGTRPRPTLPWAWDMVGEGWAGGAGESHDRAPLPLAPPPPAPQ